MQGLPHIGHVRSGLNYDVLRRWLTHGGLDVLLVRNVTDIDDKILAKAAAAGRPWWEWAATYERAFQAAYAALGCLPPSIEPRATGHVPQMIELIERLIERGHAYAAGGDVYFAVRSFPGVRRAVRPEGRRRRPGRGRDPAPSATRATSRCGRRPSPASRPGRPRGAAGRPGWHLECSAMATMYLGPEFDIHGGGLDLVFPHHENEQAQSHAAGDRFARFWLHNAWVTMGGEKMSKSLGNTLSIDALLQRVRGVELRYYLVGAALPVVDRVLRRGAAGGGGGVPADRVVRAPGARAGRHARVGHAVPRSSSPRWTTTWARPARWPPSTAPCARATPRSTRATARPRSSGGGLGAGDDRACSGSTRSTRSGPAATRRPRRATGALGTLVDDLLAQRQEARARRDFAAADAVRARLTAAGVSSRTPRRPHLVTEGRVANTMAGNSKRRGAMRKDGTKKGMVVGSGGQRRRGLEGKGPTPPAETRPGHPPQAAAAAAQRQARRRGAGRDRPAAAAARRRRDHRRPCSAATRCVECLRAGVPATALHVAVGQHLRRAGRRGRAPGRRRRHLDPGGAPRRPRPDRRRRAAPGRRAARAAVRVRPPRRAARDRRGVADARA